VSRVPFHVVGGFLGAGKTTTLTRLLAARAHLERAAVVVNDVGEAGIDEALLGDGLQVRNIPGGCVCCTAPAGLVEAVSTLLDTVRPDRIYVEPSGLAHPHDVVDMLGRGPLAGRVERGASLLLLDPGAVPPEPRLTELLEGADVVVLNRLDLAPEGALDAARTRLAKVWPPPIRVIETSHGVLPADVLDVLAQSPSPEGHGHDHDHGHGHDHGRHHAAESSTDGFEARSWSAPAEQVHRLDVVRAVAADPEVVRLKGLFRTDLGWFRVDRAGGVVHLEPTAWRRDSRVDVIAREPAVVERALAALQGARCGPEASSGQIRLEAVDGSIQFLDPARLAALPGQVPDVAAVVPGRPGQGVWLSELIALGGPAAQFVLVAEDGLVAGPTPVEGARAAVLVYALDGQPLPAKAGGPFRVLALPGEGTRCGNVKGLARVRLVGPTSP